MVESTILILTTVVGNSLNFICTFNNLDRRNLLKIAKQISENNREYDRLKQEGKIKQRGLREKYPSIDDAALIKKE